MLLFWLCSRNTKKGDDLRATERMDVVFKMFQQAISEHWQCRRISNEVEKLRKEMDDEVDGTYLEKEPRCFCFACILLTCHILGREEGLRRLGWTGANELFVDDGKILWANHYTHEIVRLVEEDETVETDGSTPKRPKAEVVDLCS